MANGPIWNPNTRMYEPIERDDRTPPEPIKKQKRTLLQKIIRYYWIIWDVLPKPFS